MFFQLNILRNSAHSGRFSSLICVQCQLAVSVDKMGGSFQCTTLIFTPSLTIALQCRLSSNVHCCEPEFSLIHQAAAEILCQCVCVSERRRGISHVILSWFNNYHFKWDFVCSGGIVLHGRIDNQFISIHITRPKRNLMQLVTNTGQCSPPWATRSS